jgi:hypothetical protein
MIRAEAIKEFGPVDAHGIIRRPGKFEHEMIYVPAIAYQAMLDGFADEHRDGSWSVAVTKEDRAEYPELKHRRRIRCTETSTGFVCEI